jgi:exopolysaccharide biosynthesis operon protein EpsL
MTALPSHPMPARRRHAALRVFLHLGAAACVPAFAASGAPAPSEDVLRPYVGYGFAYDDNALGQANGVDGKQSDTSHHAEAGLIFNKRVSQQVLSAKLNFSRVKYSKLGQLDHNAKDLLANWNWHAGSHLDGNVGASYLEALTPYASSIDSQRNLRTQRREFADGGWRLHPSWRVRAGVSREKVNYDLDAQKAADRNEKTGELGLDYLAAAGNTVGVQLRHTRGDLPNPQLIGAQLVDNSFDQNEIKAKVNWIVTGKTQLQFLGGFVRRKHDVEPARDYSGFNARVIGNWQPTGKIGVTLSGWREIGALDDLTASYTLNQGLSAGAGWELSSKLKLDAVLKHETSDFSGAAPFAAVSPDRDRKDTFLTASVKLTYRPIDRLQLGVLAYRKNRNSNLDGNSSTNNGVMLSSRYEF